MTAADLYLEAGEFLDRLGNENAIAVFDDDNMRTINMAAVNAVLKAATRLVTAAVASEYRGTLPFPSDQIPELATELTWRFAIPECAIRNPDWANAWMKGQGFTLKDWRESANQLRDDMNKALMRMVDANKPVPANVGGGLSSVVGSPNYPDAPAFVFADMGDF